MPILGRITTNAPWRARELGEFMELLILTIVVLLVVIVAQYSMFNDVVTRQKKEITDLELKYHRAVMELGIIKTNKIIGRILGK